MIRTWMIRSYSIHFGPDQEASLLVASNSDAVGIKIKTGMVDRDGEGWNRGNLMWLYAELMRYPGQYFFECDTGDPKKWKIFKKDNTMSLVNIKRTLLSAEETMEELIKNPQTWIEFLEEFPDESIRLFDNIVKKAGVLVRGSNEKSQYYVRANDQ